MTDLAAPTRSSVLRALRGQRIETASWAYGNSGTRFKVFPQEGVPRTPQEKIEDAATVHRFTGVAPTVALHIPWDKVDDYGALARYARDRGVELGVIGNLTAAELQRNFEWATVASYVTAYPTPPAGSGTEPPLISNLGVFEGEVVPNLAMLTYGVDRQAVGPELPAAAATTLWVETTVANSPWRFVAVARASSSAVIDVPSGPMRSKVWVASSANQTS